MEQRSQQIDKREQEEQESRGIVTIPYIKWLSEQLWGTANRHSFRVAFKFGRNIIKRLNAHVKSRLMKDRNALYIRFLAPIFKYIF